MKHLLILSIVLFGLSHTLQSQERDSITKLSEVTIIGNKIKKIPGSGDHISHTELLKFNQADVNKVLRNIPGVNIRDEEGFGLRPNIGLRGTPVNRSTKITIMEDGVLMAPAPYADPSAYYFPTFSRMQSIEVLKGSSQIKYGPYTIGGAINLISTSIPKYYKGFAQVSYGSFGTNMQRLWIGNSNKNIDYVFDINRYASNGFKELDNGGNTGFDRRDVMGKIRWHNAENAKIKQSFTLKFLNSTEDANETYLGLTYNDFIKNAMRRYAATQNDVLDLHHYHTTLNYIIIPIKNMSINTTAYYTNTFRDWSRINSIEGQNVTSIIANPILYSLQYAVMTGNANGNMTYQSAERNYFSKGIQSNIVYKFKTNVVAHSIEIGFRYHIDQVNRFATQSNYTMNNGTMILTSAGVKGNSENQIRNANSRASFLNYNFEYKKLTFSAGLRYENIHLNFLNFGNNDTARFGTALRSADNNLTVFLPGIGLTCAINTKMNAFAGIHKGFSPPGMPSVTTGSVQAKAETAINYELGYRFHNNYFDAQVVGFLNNYSNILGADTLAGGGAGTGDLFNAGNAKIHGIEVSVDYNLLKNNNAKSFKLPLHIAYTYTCAKFQETFVNGGGDWGTGTIYKNDFIPFITPHMVTASIGVEKPKFNVALTQRFVSKTRVKPGQNETIIPSENVNYNDVNAINSYFNLDLSTNYILNKHFTLFAIFNNITNNQNIVANLPQGYRPAMPFGINCGLKVDF